MWIGIQINIATFTFAPTYINFCSKHSVKKTKNCYVQVKILQIHMCM